MSVSCHHIHTILSECWLDVYYLYVHNNRILSKLKKLIFQVRIMQNIALILFKVMLVSDADTFVRRQLNPHAIYHAARCEFLNKRFI